MCGTVSVVVARKNTGAYYISALSCHAASCRAMSAHTNSVGSKTKSIRPRPRPVWDQSCYKTVVSDPKTDCKSPQWRWNTLKNFVQETFTSPFVHKFNQHVSRFLAEVFFSHMFLAPNRTHFISHKKLACMWPKVRVFIINRLCFCLVRCLVYGILLTAMSAVQSLAWTCIKCLTRTYKREIWDWKGRLW